MHRFFVPPDSVGEMGVLFPADAARQIRQVLRLRTGEKVTVLDGKGMEYLIQLETVSNEKVWGRLLEAYPAAGEPVLHVRLYLSLTGRDKFEWALQKCTEVGVSVFVPVISSRTLARDKEQARQKAERWERILKEAAEQSGRGLIPQITEPVALHDAYGQTKAAQIPTAVLWEGERQASFSDWLAVQAKKQKTAPDKQIAVFIGPEGGYSEEEAGLALLAGLQTVSLGRRILRMETAALVAAALALNVFGDMR
jgi:16S rRNA (uracil1498-N3)-methyltransferase